MEAVVRVAHGSIDFEGQRVAERIYQVILTTAAALGFIVGFVRQDLALTAYTFAGGILLSLAVCVPAWPLYNRYDVKWVDTA
ncbi:hypothetical protein MSPP1_000802 [Malassezia sp. CBS 17886]|nr:hypothetical protein MSPP1_000802 [Malassezia sp. CBS 17886]